MLSSNKKAEADEVKFSALFYKYIPYWPLLLVFLFFTIGAAYVYLYFQNPKYEATASIILKDEKKDDKSKQSLNLDPLQTKNIIENEVEVLKSRSLMDSVVKSLHLYAPVTIKQKYKSVAAYTKSPVIIEAQDPEEIEDVTEVPFSYHTGKDLVIIHHVEYPVNNWVSTPYGVLRFTKKNKIPKQDQVLHFSLLSSKKAADKYVKSLKISVATKLSGVVNLSIKDEVPKRAENILNRLIDVYNYSIVKEKNDVAVNTLSFVEERLSSVSKELDSIERHIQQYKAGASAIDISTQGRLFLQNVSENDQKLSDINMKLAVLSQVEKFASSRNNNGSIVPATLGMNDPVLSKLLDQLYAAELEYERLRRTVGENNSVLVSVTDQINKIRPNILENIQSQRQSLLASRSNLSTTNNSYNNLLQTLPQKEKELLEISREQSIKSNIYSFLLQKREESAIAGAGNFSDVKIIDKAQSTFTPVSPNKKMVYGISIAVAVLALIGLVGIREGFNLKILFRKEIESLTSMSVIGEIGFEKNKDAVVVQEGHRTFISEEFRKIRVTLPYLGIGSSKKKILVTSSIPGEGKSFIALNLAQTLALTGKKVVLIDMDLNRPSLGNTIGMTSENGVSQVLLNQANIDDVVFQTDFNNNLFFIATGKLPKNPSELLMSERVKSLFATLNGMFDYIVIDTAPVVPVSDAYILSSLCDATLFVVRHNYTPKMMLERLDQALDINPLTNASIIFNGVSKRGLVNSNYGYGYSYSYMTSYLDDKKGKSKK
jgi:tyrosine-protein kinase Etk/Wzc